MCATYRVGIVGCGGMANRHAISYAGMSRAKLVAAADMSPAHLGAFADRWQITNTYTDYHAMLAAESLDLLSVTTWEDSHGDIVVAAAESGIRGILCEKPMAMNLAQADDMIAACDNAGAVLAIGHMRRYNEFYRGAKALMESGQLGEIQLMRAYCRGWDIFLWGTHYADMLLFLNDDKRVDWVMGQISWQQRGMAYAYSDRDVRRKGDRFVAEDSALGWMGFENGIRAILETGIHSPQDWPQGPEGPMRMCDVTIYGTLGMAMVSDRHLAHCTVETGQWVCTEPASEEERAQLSQRQFTGELDELVDCVECGGEHQLNGRRGRAALEVIMAIYESSRRRTVVELPLHVDDNPFLSMVASGSIP